MSVKEKDRVYVHDFKNNIKLQVEVNKLKNSN